jgi:hypothetical protein
MVSYDGRRRWRRVHQGENRTVIIRVHGRGASCTRELRSDSSIAMKGDAICDVAQRSQRFPRALGYTSRTGQPNKPGLSHERWRSELREGGGTSFDGMTTACVHPENAFSERDDQCNIRTWPRRAILRRARVWRSIDGGTTWTQRVDPVWPVDHRFFCDPTVRDVGRRIAPPQRRREVMGQRRTSLLSFTKRACGASGGARTREGDTFNTERLQSRQRRDVGRSDNAQNRCLGSNVSVDPWRAGQIWIAGSRSSQLGNPLRRR